MATPTGSRELFRSQDTEGIRKKAAERHGAKEIPNKRAREKEGKMEMMCKRAEQRAQEKKNSRYYNLYELKVRI